MNHLRGLEVYTYDHYVLLRVVFEWNSPGYVFHSTKSTKNKKKAKSQEKSEKWDSVTE